VKLNYRYTLAYAILTFFVLSIGFAIVYTALSRSVTQATIGKLENLNTLITNQLRSGQATVPDSLRQYVQVSPVAATDTARRGRTVQVRPEWDTALQARAGQYR
jgi:two-component system OmpR family sensor kinase